VELGDRCPSHACNSNRAIGSLALYSRLAIVLRARRLVILPRTALAGTPAVVDSAGMIVRWM
jgi:hypothetical protein